MIFWHKNNKISKCFYDHHDHVVSCFENFEEFFAVLFSDNPDQNKLESAKVLVDSCEGSADTELRHVVDAMKESFLPLTRSNLISVVQCTDEIANKCQSIVRQIMLEKIDIPTSLREDVAQIIEITKKQLGYLYTALDMLLNDFKGISKDKKILDDIRGEESHVDNIEALLHERIFELDITLCEKVYYRDLIEDICQISDIIEDISDRMQVMIVEREA